MRVRLAQVVVLAMTSAILVLATTVSASTATPPSDTVAVPTTVGTAVTKTWSGTIPAPAVGPTSSCIDGPLSDKYMITITGAPTPYTTFDAEFRFSITWAPPGPEDVSDEILTVLDSHGNEIGSSDGSSHAERVT